MRVLVTGGAGFIGAHVAKALVARGDTPVLLDDFNDFLYPAEVKRERLAALFPDEKSRPEVIEGSILAADTLEQAFGQAPFDAVLHLAAHPNPGFSLDKAEAYLEVNVLGTLRMLEAAVKHEVANFIFAGSSSVYNDEQTPFREDMYPLRPRSPYGVSKAAAEEYCALWHELYGLPVTVLRFFSVYGPWGRPDMAPSIFAEKILAGETIKLSSDRQRDFTYIDDTVAGVLLALDHTFEFEVINLGRGEPVALKDFVHGLEEAAGLKATIAPREAPPGEMRATYSDTSKAKKLLGYEPKVSVREGATKLVEWMKSD